MRITFTMTSLPQRSSCCTRVSGHYKVEPLSLSHYKHHASSTPVSCVRHYSSTSELRSNNNSNNNNDNISSNRRRKDKLACPSHHRKVNSAQYKLMQRIRVTITKSMAIILIRVIVIV